jgi:uncharacterized protein (DUF2062 family)
MPRRFFTRLSVRYKQKDQPWYLRPFRFVLTHPVYFSANRKSVAGGLWLGLFIAFMPMPGHMILAILAALLLRVNIPVAALAVWVTNPLTVVPIFYLAYRLGCAVMDIPVQSFPEEFSWNWMTTEFIDVWKPLWFGSMILATSIASAAYILINVAWRISTAYRYRRRHLFRGGSGTVDVGELD